MLIGSALGGLIGSLPSIKNLVQNIFKNSKHSKNITTVLPIAIGGVAGVISAFPLYSWAAKAEVAASRRGRFEAMRKDLSNPNGFAVLTEEQTKLAKERAKQVILPKEKKSGFSNLSNSINTLKEIIGGSAEYRKQKRLFEYELMDAERHMNDKMTPEEIEKAKKDQQLLTKLVEKIDIASQDYAENAELATQSTITAILALGALFNIVLTKVLNAMKIKNASKISAITQVASITLPLGFSIAAAQIQKQASRVGRYKIKQELLNNPEKLAYVSDENIKNMDKVAVLALPKENLLQFLKNAWKNNKEYNLYKKTQAVEEEKFYKALNDIKLTPEQLKDAKILQRNTFKTFNKVDEKSQKYAESIEALGQAAATPISLIFVAIGTAIGMKYLAKGFNNKISNYEKASNISKYLGAILLSSLPSIGINAYITKEQKKASRIADMLAINEMQDYRHFR